MIFKKDDLIAIFGKRGSGKSTLCKFIQKSFPRVIVLDLLNEYVPEAQDTVVKSMSEFLNVITKVINQKIPSFRIIFKVDILKGDITEDAIKVMRIALTMGDVFLVFEEMHEIFPQSSRLEDESRKLILLGRHKGVGIIGTSQRAALVSKTFVTQCSHVFVSRMVELNDLNYFKNTISINPDTLRKLKDFTFIYSNNGELKGTVKAPIK